jgi:PAS domain S-box-containing protein
MEFPTVEILKNRHHLLDLVQVAFIITDVHSKILYTNRYTGPLLGYPRGEIEGQRIRILFLEEDLTYFLPNIVYLTLYKNGFEGEALIKQKDGTKIFVYISTNSFKEEGEVFLTFSLQEIQRLKKLERERLEMERWASLGMMVEEISHQVRNPIVSIGGYTQRLLEAFSSSQKSKSYCEKILRETRRLEMMIQRVEETTLQTFSKGAAEKGISLNLETGALEGEGNLFIDKDLVIKVLSHILENSMEAITEIPVSKKRTAVKVTLFEDKEGVRVSISDKGEGIAKKNLDRIFEPFFSTRPNRVGLGLTFAKRVVEEHGGRIRVESRLKRGTTIDLYFPKERRREVRRKLISPEAMEERIR